MRNWVWVFLIVIIAWTVMGLEQEAKPILTASDSMHDGVLVVN